MLCLKCLLLPIFLCLLNGAGASEPEKPFLPKRPHVAERPLYIETALTEGGKANAAIVIPAGDRTMRENAERIAAVLAETGVALPIVSDTEYQDITGLTRNLILLPRGNEFTEGLRERHKIFAEGLGRLGKRV